MSVDTKIIRPTCKECVFYKKLDDNPNNPYATKGNCHAEPPSIPNSTRPMVDQDDLACRFFMVEAVYEIKDQQSALHLPDRP